jgi:DNA-binding IclR family transcriptional regulator
MITVPAKTPAPSPFQQSSVRNALLILNSFTIEQPQQRVADLAASLGLGTSTVSRLLSTLASEGYVSKDPETRKYRLGLRILTLNSVLMAHLELKNEARSSLTKLMEETSETTQIAVLEDQCAVYLEQIECAHPVRIMSYVGRRNPLHCTASGKVLLAFQSKATIHQMLNQELKQYASHTVTDPAILAKQLSAIRSQEFCICTAEFVEGVVSVAAAVRDHCGAVIAAVSLVGPIQRMQKQHLAVYVPKVVDAAQHISQRLGYQKKRPH